MQLQQQQTTAPHPTPLSPIVPTTPIAPAPGLTTLPVAAQGSASSSPAPSTVTTMPVVPWSAAVPAQTTAQQQSVVPAVVSAGAASPAGKMAEWTGVLIGFTVAVLSLTLLLASSHNVFAYAEALFIATLMLSSGWRRRMTHGRRASARSASMASREKRIAALFTLATGIACFLCAGCLTEAGAYLQHYPWIALLRAEPIKAYLVAANAGASAYILCEQLRLRRERRALRPASP